MNYPERRGAGFGLLELIVAMAIFMIICAAMFELLNLSQKKFSSETQLTAAYQDARLAMDQIVRDVDAAGYPPVALFSPLPTAHPSRYALFPVAWNPNYGVTDCQIGVCVSPGDYDLIPRRESTSPIRMRAGFGITSIPLKISCFGP